MANYTILWAWVMVLHVMFNDILVRGVVLYPLGVTIDFWEEISYYCLDGNLSQGFIVDEVYWGPNWKI
jgi:hypothetical protein